MDYKEKYKAAIERAKEELGSGCFNKGSIEYIFPELKESAGEKIREALIDYFEGWQTRAIDENAAYYKDIAIKDILAWLEKQGEQKSADKVEPEQKEEIADRNMETTEENEGKRLYYTLNWVISIYGQLDEKAKREAEELFPELKEISTLSPFERKLMELCNFCAHKGKILTAASARYAAKSFLSLAMEHKKAMEDKK